MKNLMASYRTVNQKMKILHLDEKSKAMLVKSTNGFILFDCPIGVGKILDKHRVEDDLTAIFFSTHQGTATEGILELGDWMKQKKYTHPVPTYVSQHAFKSFILHNQKNTHLDLSTIRENTRTPIGDAQITAYPAGEARLTFSIEEGKKQEDYTPTNTEEDATIQNTATLMAQAFGSPGGKATIATRIVKRIPPHETYVEPFCGGAAVYFKKKPSQTEVLSDLDPAVTAAYTFLKHGTPQTFQQAERLLQQPVNKSAFMKIKDRVDVGIKPNPQGFADFYRLNYHSFGMDRRSYGYVDRKPSLNADRMMQLKERLSNTEVLTQDAMEVIRKYDSPNTFHYLDPPYFENWRGEEKRTERYTEESFRKLVNTLRTIQGKFLLSINNTKQVNAILGNDFKKNRIYTRRSVENRPGKDAKRGEYELLVSNYDITAQSMSEFSLASHQPDYPTNIILTRNFITETDDGILIRLGQDTEHLKKAIASRLSMFLDDANLSYDPMGAHTDSTPRYHLALVKTNERGESMMSDDFDSIIIQEENTMDELANCAG